MINFRVEIFLLKTEIMKKKLKLAFSELEKEMLLIGNDSLTLYKGGGGWQLWNK